MNWFLVIKHEKLLSLSGYDISSHMTDTDILDGIVAISIVALFVMLGVYSQRLAHKLFEHPKILEMMRLHSKTIMKLNACILLIVILASFTVTLNMATFDYSYFEVPFDNSTIEVILFLSNVMLDKILNIISFRETILKQTQLMIKILI